MKRLMTVLVSVLAFILVTFNAQAALAFEAEMFGGEICPPGYTYVTYQEAVENRDYLCRFVMYPEIFNIARIADGGSLSGLGHQCALFEYDDRTLGHCLCKL